MDDRKNTEQKFSMSSLEQISGGVGEGGGDVHCKHAYIDPDVCILCGNCETECDFEAIYTDDRGYVVNQALCTGCGRCADHCPTEAISLR